MAFSVPEEPFSVSDPLGDARDEAMRQNRLLQAANDPLAFGQAESAPALPDPLAGGSSQEPPLNADAPAFGDAGAQVDGEAENGPGQQIAAAGPSATQHIVQLLHPGTAAASPDAVADSTGGATADAKRAAARDFGAHYLMDIIPKGEGTSSYDAVFSDGAGTGKNYPAGWKRPTQLAVDEAIRMAPDLRRTSGGSVIGKYQFEPGTLVELKTSMRLKGSEVLTPALQYRMARQLMHRSGYDDYLAEYIKPADLQKGLAKQWSSFAEGPSDFAHQFDRSRPPKRARMLTRDIQPAIAAAGSEGTPALTRALDEGHLPPDWR